MELGHDRKALGLNHHVGSQGAGERSLRTEPDIRRRLAGREESGSVRRMNPPSIPGIERDIGEELLGGR